MLEAVQHLLSLNSLEASLAWVLGIGGASLAVVYLLLKLAALWSERRMQKAVADRTQGIENASRRYRLLADQAWDMIAIVRATGEVEYANSAFGRVLGLSRETLRGKVLAGVLNPHDAALLQTRIADVVAGAGADAAPLQLRGLHAEGRIVPLEIVVRGLPDADWLVRSAVVHLRDVSQREQAAAEIAQSEQRFKDFAASSADVLWETDPRGAFTYISPGVMQVLGYNPHDLMGRQVDEILLAAADDDSDTDPVRDLLVSRMERHENFRDIEIWSRAGTGERVCLRLSGVAVQADNGLFGGYRGVASNVTASKIDRDNMFRLATTDHLTGLLNRNRFKEELERAVGLARRHHTQGVVMFIDLDRFKEINDTHGHEAGDKILTSVAELLREAVRSTDVVARLGGDEFGVIMHNIDAPTAVEKVQALVERVNVFGIDYHGTRLSTTMSIGMVHYPQEEKDVEYLIMNADMAMYRAKNMGRNRLFMDEVGSTAEQSGSIRAQLKWLDRLKVCLETGDFEMHYQAIVPAHKQQRPLFEALLRIYDEQGKVVSPALYIDAAEHFGHIQQLDLAVVRRVFETQAELQAEKVDVDITINLSSRTMGDPDVARCLQSLREELDIDPTRIIFEVTETMALHDPAQMRDIGEIKEFIDSLRAAGFRVALDDFGTGFTSFKYLRLLAVDLVKIDGEYVKGIANDASDQLFVRSMADLCKGLGIATIAEFVEDEAAMNVLKELDVDYGQGWHFAKPVADIRTQARNFAGLTYDDFTAATKAAKAQAQEAPAKTEKTAGKTGKAVPRKAQQAQAI